MGRCVLLPTDEALESPLFHFVGRVLEKAGHEVSVGQVAGPDNEAVITVGFGSACRSVGVGAGVWFSPDFADAATAAAFSVAPGPGLVVGSHLDRGWDRAAAARLLQFEVLQLPHVDRFIEVPGDPVATLHVFERILDRVAALVKSVG